MRTSCSWLSPCKQRSWDEEGGLAELSWARGSCSANVSVSCSTQCTSAAHAGGLAVQQHADKTHQASGSACIERPVLRRRPADSPMEPHLKSVEVAPSSVTPGRPALGPVYVTSGAQQRMALPQSVNSLWEGFHATCLRNGPRRCLGWRPVGRNGRLHAYSWHSYRQASTQSSLALLAGSCCSCPWCKSATGLRVSAGRPGRTAAPEMH